MVQGWLTGWQVLHHGSVTFGPTGGNTSPALRRNLSRLLAVMGAGDLDTRAGRDAILARLLRRELEGSPVRLAVPNASRAWRQRQAYAGAHAAGSRYLPAGEFAWVCGPMPNPGQRQWLPWLANELLLQPEAEIVGAHGWYALRSRGEDQPPVLTPEQAANARSVGPPAPLLMSRLPPRRRTLRQILSALRHDWRHRNVRLPAGW